MDRLELRKLAGRNVVVTLVDGTVLGGHYEDNGDGSVAFWGEAAVPTSPHVLESTEPPTDIAYDEIDFVKSAV